MVQYSLAACQPSSLHKSHDIGDVEHFDLYSTEAAATDRLRRARCKHSISVKDADNFFLGCAFLFFFLHFFHSLWQVLIELVDLAVAAGERCWQKIVPLSAERLWPLATADGAEQR